MKLWVDVEDIFHYALHVKRPSGIQRVAFELQRALVELAPDSVQFIRHGKQHGSFVIVPFARLEALFGNLAATHPAVAQAPMPEAEEDVEVLPEPPAPPEPQVEPAGSCPAMSIIPQLPPAPPRSLYRRLRRRGLNVLPQPLREPATRLWIKAAETRAAAASLLRAVFSLNTWHRPEPAWPAVPDAPVSRVAAAVARAPEREAVRAPPGQAAGQGGWLVVLGSPWSSPGYAGRISAFCAQHELRLALLLYDIIPLRRPEWVDYGLRLAFQEWFHSVVPLADVVLAISQATARDVERYAKQTSLTLRGRVQPIPLGTGFRPPVSALRTRRLPARRSFALIVATIEARKNHLLLFRIWRELTELLPMEKIPTLVFAGRVGWLVQDLMQQMHNTDWLNGKIMLIDSPSDAELATLYSDCLFTLYPSFYEGWGLPVTESLAYGAPCISSNRTSLPEAGGDLAIYFDPDNLPEAVRKVREVIEDPKALQAWRARVAREFRPVSWTESARAIIGQLHNAGEAQAPPRRAATIAAAD